MNTLTKMKEQAPALRTPGMTPFLDELRRDMEGFWDRPFLFRPMRPLREVAASALEWAPSLDVFDKNGELFVKADLPGVKKEDVTVALEEGDLVIRGHRKAETEVKDADYYRCERTHGEFYRRMALAFAADPKKIEAKFADGVLEVRIPYPLEKKPEPKKIEVK